MAERRHLVGTVPAHLPSAHTICISDNAVDKHLALHGDYLGARDPGDGDGGGDDGDAGSYCESGCCIPFTQ